jgi:hypothetical protein
MGWTKREFIQDAYAEIGMADYEFDLQTQDLQFALRKLDSMMATWNFQGIRVGYPLPSSPSSSDIDAQTNVPDSANQAIVTGLAIRIAPSFGKTVSVETKTSADIGYKTLLSLAAMPGEMQLPSSMPSGAGHKDWRYYNGRFLNPPIDPLLAGEDSELEFE